MPARPPKPPQTPPRHRTSPPAPRYPLAIVLDHQTWRRWQRFKQQVGRSRDRDAFALLLARATEEGWFPDDA